mmetsp:Transcript_25696/g.28576  ORF Transcript_25696/g.28576 Transcript_25696/m.28576 type:complete len:131 (+) Transcript_25696:74-466(+)|eukprot:CAMPEP_0168521162 /NCGR_PEP_ID=MMETSP0405-20121227/8487_1 /TAXON_ID=498012 /ORGANISM="Trichosphaerium sp, Strain Am-I-7 wt" /LENGTH=130 /DNA_ID=CAMNT_0008542319 /DNA_START=48 /DNA_END=440 /DNA_ORIENTATION=+
MAVLLSSQPLWRVFSSPSDDFEDGSYLYSPKACHTLGRRKLLAVLGYTQETELKEAIETQIEEEFLHCGPYNQCVGRPKIVVHKHSKACKLLGYDPSEAKLQDILGIDDIEEAIKEAQNTSEEDEEWYLF